jgi:hypothetical protein
MVVLGGFQHDLGSFPYMRFLVKISLYAIFGQKWGKYMQFLVKNSPKWWLVPFLYGREGKILTKNKKERPALN